jgi:conjugal transfer pilus assembly protein TraB
MLRGIQSIDLNLENTLVKSEGEYFKIGDYVPAGSYAQATIISGVDASVGVQAQSDPRPVLLRITGPAFASIYDGNAQKSDISGCLITGAASGDLGSEKVYIKLVNMSCAKSEDLVFETAVKGYVAGQGKSGLVGGFGQGLSSRVAPPLNFSSGVTLQNGYSNEDVVKKGVGQGISSASDRLSNYFINRAEQYQPVVSIPSGLEVEVVFVEGFQLNSKRHRTPTQINGNRFINKFEAGQQ